MITISELAPNVQQVKISGKVQSADMRQVVDLAETIGKGAEKASLVFEVENVEGLEWSALGEELSHLPAMWRMLTGLDRIAVIADQSWLRSAARIESALLPGVTYEVFSRDKAEQARAWARGEIDRPHADAVRLVDVGHSSIVAFELDGRIDEDNAATVIKDARLALEKTGARRRTGTALIRRCLRPGISPNRKWISSSSLIDMRSSVVRNGCAHLPRL